jgi:hypothetical protein
MNSNSNSEGLDAWTIAQRWFEYEGEIRVAVMRVSLVTGLYGLQLLNHYVFSSRSAEELLFHRHASLLASVGLFLSLIVLVALIRRYFPLQLKFATCLADIALLTLTASMASGPASPLVGIYYLLIATAAMRCSITLIWVATAASLVGYMALVGLADEQWFDADHATSPVTQLVVLATLITTGGMTAQLVKMIGQAAQTFVNRQQLLAERGAHHG